MRERAGLSTVLTLSLPRAALVQPPANQQPPHHDIHSYFYYDVQGQTTLSETRKSVSMKISCKTCDLAWQHVINTVTGTRRGDRHLLTLVRPSAPTSPLRGSVVTTGPDAGEKVPRLPYSCVTVYVSGILRVWVGNTLIGTPKQEATI